MLLARVIGTATATVKHSALERWRLMVVQPLGAAGDPDGPPMLAIDDLGARRGEDVMITSDGKTVREMMGRDDSPVRWAVLGLKD